MSEHGRSCSSAATTKGCPIAKQLDVMLPQISHCAELKMDLVDIQAEAARLRERKGRGEQAKAPDERLRIEEQLDALKKKADRGAVTAEEYERERAKLLKRFLDLK